MTSSLAATLPAIEVPTITVVPNGTIAGTKLLFIAPLFLGLHLPWHLSLLYNIKPMPGRSQYLQLLLATLVALQCVCLMGAANPNVVVPVMPTAVAAPGNYSEGA